MNGWETEAFIAQDNIRKRRHAKFIKLFDRNHFTMMTRIFLRVHILKCFASFTRILNGLITFLQQNARTRKTEIETTVSKSLTTNTYRYIIYIKPISFRFFGW